MSPGESKSHYTAHPVVVRVDAEVDEHAPDPLDQLLRRLLLETDVVLLDARADRGVARAPQTVPFVLRDVPFPVGARNQ